MSTPIMSIENRVITNILHLIPVLKRDILKSGELYEKTGLQFPQAQVLLALSEQENMTVSQLSKYTGIAAPNITPIIDRLCTMGLVDRQHNDTDRRMVDIRILPAGEERFEDFKNLIASKFLHGKGALSNEQILSLDQALTTIIRIIGTDSSAPL